MGGEPISDAAGVTVAEAKVIDPAQLAAIAYALDGYA
jgi:hypothetical protein